MNKRLWSRLAPCCVAALAVVVLGSSGLAEPGQQLEFLTWFDYVDPELVAEFERETGATVEFTYYSSDDHRDEMLAGSGASEHDLVAVSGLMVQAYAARGWLAAIAPESVPNLKHVEPRWRNAFPGVEEHGVPYFWGTLGIGYRKDLLPEGISTWKEFYQPPQSLRGRIALPKSSRDIVGMALKALGHSANSDDRNAIREAGRLLEGQKPFVASYGYVSLSEESALVSGEVWASMLYSGDVVQLRRYQPDIEYVVPEEGTNLWCDYLVVLEASHRKDLAVKFIDFLNRPEIAARNARFLSYATPNSAARDRLPAEYRENPIINPPEEVIARSEPYRLLAPRVQKAVNSVFAAIVD
jgi:spermidine/putrescine transport system substrate-binding protein